MSSEGQPCSCRGSLSEHSLVDAASTGGGAGTGSWRFISRLIVANGAKVRVTMVPAYGQVSLYNCLCWA